MRSLRNIIRVFPFELLGVCFLILFTLSSCSNFSEGVGFGFLSSSPTSASLTDNNASLFGQGTSAGGFALWDSTNNYLRLEHTSDTGGVNAADTELSADWTPAWSNLVGYWKFNETSGTTFANSAPVSSGAGTLTGTVTVGAAGKLNHAVSIAGAGYMDIASSVAGSGNLNIASNFTISAWINVNDINHPYMIVSEGGSLHNWPFALEVTPIYATGGTIGLFTDNGPSSSYYTFSSPRNAAVTNSNITSGDWWHVVVTSDGTNVNFYLNGLPDAGNPQTIATGTTSSTPDFQIGGFNMGSQTCPFAGGSCEMNGKIDDVAVWNTVLSPQAIASIYQHESAKYAGTFQSRVMNALSPTTWTSLSWNATLPFFKALPDYALGSIQNETSTNYPSLVGDTSSIGDNNLMTGLIGLWHLDETALSGGGGSGLDFRDSSGNGNWAAAVGTLRFGQVGKFGTSLTGDGHTSLAVVPITTGSVTPFRMSTNYTLSTWINMPQYPTTEAALIHYDDEYSLRLTTGGQICLNDTEFDSACTTAALTVGQWYHVVAVMGSTASMANIQIYLNGVNQGALSTNGTWAPGGAGGGSCTDATSCLSADNFIGLAGIGNNYYNLLGTLDEVAIWSKALTPAEVLQLYRRGANRIEYQVRSCPDSSCSTNPPWLGPDGSNQTYFTELNNNAIQSAGGDVTTSGTVLPGLPKMIYSNFGGLLLGTNPYFQYRAIMESDDPGTGCNYGLGPNTAWCSPELQAVTAAP